MSQQGLDLIRSGFELLERGDMDAFEQYMASDVVMIQPPEVPDAKDYRGPTAMCEAMADWPRQWEDFRMTLLGIHDAGEDVYVSATRHTGRGRESGIAMNFEVFYVHRLRDGKLARLEMYFTREQALAAAGSP
jgi:ketosteroid isomerase-like protein